VTISASAALGLLFTLLIGVRWRASMWHRRRRPARCLTAQGRGDDAQAPSPSV
jgi:hypothetical protein